MNEASPSARQDSRSAVRVSVMPASATRRAAMPSRAPRSSMASMMSFSEKLRTT